MFTGLESLSKDFHGYFFLMVLDSLTSVRLISLFFCLCNYSAFKYSTLVIVALCIMDEALAVNTDLTFEPVKAFI